MASVPAHPDRRIIRLRDYDYTLPGAYFLTICAHNRECLFGRIVDHEMIVNASGRIIREEWERSASVRREIEPDMFVVMPNHVHGLVFIHERDTGCGTGSSQGPSENREGGDRRSPLRPRGPSARSLAAFVAGFKSAVTRRIGEHGGIPGDCVWQRNYYEHVVRNERDLDLVRRYIVENPLLWDRDLNNLEARRADSISWK